MYWPKIDYSRKTDSIISFINEIISDLHVTYENKLDGEFSLLVYEQNDNLSKIHSSLKAMGKLPFSVGKEVLSDSEKNKIKIVTENEKTYKFIISSAKNYYRLFDVTMSDFFPVKIQILDKIINTDNKEIVIQNIETFKDEIIKIINSNFVKNLIMKMLDNLK